MPSPQSGHGIYCIHLILWKISKIGATRRQILRLKCAKFDFRWGSARTPRGELSALPQTPVAAFKGAYFKGKGEGRGQREGEGKRRGG